MGTTIFYVLARPGRVVPMLGRGRKRLPCGTLPGDEQRAARVEWSRYYKRLLAEGEIVTVSPELARPELVVTPAPESAFDAENDDPGDPGDSRGGAR